MPEEKTLNFQCDVDAFITMMAYIIGIGYVPVRAVDFGNGVLSYYLSSGDGESPISKIVQVAIQTNVPIITIPRN